MRIPAFLLAFLITTGSQACSLAAPYVHVDGPGISCKLLARDLARTSFRDLLSSCGSGLAESEVATLGEWFSPRPDAYTHIEYQPAPAYAIWLDKAGKLAANQCNCSLIEHIERKGEWTKFEGGHKSCRFSTACWTAPPYCLVSFGTNPEPVFIALSATILAVTGFAGRRERARGRERAAARADAGGRRTGGIWFIPRLVAHLLNLLAWFVCLGAVLLYLRSIGLQIDTLTALAVAAVSAPFAFLAWKLTRAPYGRASLPLAIGLLVVGLGLLVI